MFCEKTYETRRNITATNPNAIIAFFVGPTSFYLFYLIKHLQATPMPIHFQKISKDVLQPSSSLIYPNIQRLIKAQRHLDKFILSKSGVCKT